MSDSQNIDGRRARRERGRVAVLDAMVELVQQGHLPPTAEQVAGRAGVSVASLFRYFDDLDDLQRQMVGRFLEQYEGLFEIPSPGAGSLDRRIRALVDARLALYDTIAPFARLTRARSLERPTIAAGLHEMRARLTDQVRSQFASELRGSGPARADDILGCIVTLTSFESWDLHLSDLGRTPRQIRRAWAHALTALLAPPPPH